mmetsp:Transcript_106903/g.267964  ORF Transcript_106903/g.267964 Transcript_106903/m.267964 type:complete len:565 (-) Transcript_106903:169-1863(-)
MVASDDEQALLIEPCHDPTSPYIELTETTQCNACRRELHKGVEARQIDDAPKFRCIKCCDEAGEQIAASRLGRMQAWLPIFWMTWCYRLFYWLTIFALGYWSLSHTTIDGGVGWQVYSVYTLLLLLHLGLEGYLVKRLTNIQVPECEPIRTFYNELFYPTRIAFFLQASILALLFYSCLDHLDGHRDAWNITFVFKSDSSIQGPWLASWRAIDHPAIDTLTTFLARAHFSGFLAWQFLSFTVASQFLTLAPKLCWQLSGFVVLMWAPDLVCDALGDAKFSAIILLVVAVGVPMPLSKIALCWASSQHEEHDTLQDFISRYGVAGVVETLALPALGTMINTPVVHMLKAWKVYHKLDLHAGDEQAIVLDTIICAEGAGLVAFSSLCAKYGSDNDAFLLAQLRDKRFIANKAILENCREMWMQASFFSFTKASMSGLAQAKFLALFALGIVSMAPKLKEYMQGLAKFYNRGTSVLKFPDPPQAFLPRNAPGTWGREWIQYFHMIDTNPLLQLVRDGTTCLVLIIGMALAVLSCVKVGFAYHCASSVWNLTTGCVSLDALEHPAHGS